MSRGRGRPVGSNLTLAQLRMRTARDAFHQAEKARRIADIALDQVEQALKTNTALPPGVAETIKITTEVVVTRDRAVLECAKQARGTPADVEGAEGPGGPTPDVILKELTQGKKS